MKAEAMDADFRRFVFWALEQRDLDLMDDVSRFLSRLYLFAGMRFGGNEYEYQFEATQNAAHKLMRSAEKKKRGSVPISLQIMSQVNSANRLALDLARSFVPVACEMLELPPLEIQLQPCVMSSLPPA